MTVQQGSGAGKNLQDLISLVWHGIKVGDARLKTKRKSSTEVIVTNSGVALWLLFPFREKSPREVFRTWHKNDPEDVFLRLFA